MPHPVNVQSASASATATTASSGVTLGDLIVQALTRHSSSEAFVAGDRRLTYAQVRDLLSQYMTALARRGAGLGAGVTMLSPNMPESWIVQAATYLLGERFTGLQALASVEDHIVVCEDAEATVLVAPAPLEEHGRHVLTEAGSLRHLMVISAAGGLPEGESHGARPLDAGPATETDVAWLQYTGGTTGRPKGVMQPHRSMVQMVYAHMADFEQPHLPRYLASAPLTHATGLGVIPTLLRGGTVVIEQGFDPGRFGPAVHVLVTNDGGPPIRRISELTDDVWLQAFARHFFYVVRSVRATLPHMTAEGGASSTSSRVSFGVRPSAWQRPRQCGRP
ncbi:AMP-binding protein [Nonomuraea sp. NPDC000554]|uniref:AMP-binding protein n=1 Tax=Nonomuraea sp. NPDC000554 TaxID=3154259 RepID=UPI003326DC81